MFFFISCLLLKVKLNDFEEMQQNQYVFDQQLQIFYVEQELQNLKELRDLLHKFDFFFLLVEFHDI